MGLALQGDSSSSAPPTRRRAWARARPRRSVDLILSKNLNHKADLHGVDRLRVQRPDPGRSGHRQRLQVGHRPQRPGLRDVPAPGRGDGQEYYERVFDQTNPVDLIVGPVFWIKPGFFIRPAFSYALNFDDRGAERRASTRSRASRSSIGYHPGTPCCEVYTPPPPPPPPGNRPPTVTLDCLKDTLLAG